MFRTQKYAIISLNFAKRRLETKNIEKYQIITFDTDYNQEDNHDVFYIEFTTEEDLILFLTD